MEEQLLGKKRGGDIPPAEETPASSSYVKDKEGRKNESTAHAEPQPANPAGGATEQAQSTSGTSDMQHLFTCMHLCGFTAAYDEGCVCSVYVCVNMHTH